MVNFICIRQSTFWVDCECSIDGFPNIRQRLLILPGPGLLLSPFTNSRAFSNILATFCELFGMSIPRGDTIIWLFVFAGKRSCIYCSVKIFDRSSKLLNSSPSNLCLFRQLSTLATMLLHMQRICGLFVDVRKCCDVFPHPQASSRLQCRPSLSSNYVS